MKKEDFLKLGLTEEQATAVADASQEELKGYVEKKTYDEKVTENDILNKKMTDSSKNSAVDMAILKANGKNSKAIKALLDMEKISVKEDGTLEGLDLDALKESDSYLFATEETRIEGTGFKQGSASQDTIAQQFENGVFDR